MLVSKWLVPAVILFMMSMETILSYFQNKKIYYAPDTRVDLIISFIALPFAMLMKVAMMKMFLMVEPYQLLKYDFTWMHFVLLFLICDLYYYGFHVLSHKSRFFWASHVTHHSSKYYNYAVALRNPFTTTIYHFVIWVPLAFLGFPPLVILLIDNFIVWYAFMLHTETLGKFGFLEKIFNTPSHHRTHHGMNDKYLDKNFGGVLIIWDRIFGTYVEETEPTRFGLASGEVSYSVMHVLFAEWVRMFRDAWKAKSMREACSILFGKPGKKKLYIEKNISVEATKNNAEINISDRSRTFKKKAEIVSMEINE